MSLAEYPIVNLNSELLRYASVLVPPGEAEDLVQETWLSAQRSIKNFDPSQGSFAGWVTTILQRRAKDF
jgi:DNA-directed RNA polymerase specialized sigma24 family protein